jgi:membrane fusion protein, multidrug efflux system
MRINIKKLLFFVPILVAIILFIFLVLNKSKPNTESTKEQTAFVKTFKVENLTVIPKLTGYGTAEPGKVWKAVSEVSGRIIWMNDRLDSGLFFKKGEKLLEIDNSVYKLKIVQYKAEIKKIEANILELKAKKQNLEESLELLKKILAFNIKEFERNEKLAKSKAVSTSALEQAEISVLSQKTNIQEINNSLSLIPSQLQYQQAQLEAAKSLLSEIRLDLEHTVISAPFDCRISNVNVEISQYIQTGQELLTADSTDFVEVTAQVDTGKLDILTLYHHTGENMPLSNIHLILKATVKFQPNGKIYKWKAVCDRIETIDPNTRTVGVVAVVSNPYNSPNNSTALTKGMYCEVNITGPPIKNCIVIPRAAIHENKVYKVTKENRLDMVDIEVKYNLSEFSVIGKGVSAGDIIISSDVLPAINGMKLKTIPDNKLEARIKKEATGDK